MNSRLNIEKVIEILNLTPLNGGDLSLPVTGFSSDSRQIKHNDIFFAIPGTQADGFIYSDIAINNGASVTIHQRNQVVDGILNLKSSNVRNDYSRFCSLFYGEPSLKLNLAGFTGTNGKTTSVYIYSHLLNSLGKSAGKITTVEIDNGSYKENAIMTTPDSEIINRHMHTMVENGLDYCGMEVSSHAIAQQRIAGLNFKSKVFTNLTRDHLDYHGTFARYGAIKLSFLKDSDPGTIILANSDDPFFPEIKKNIPGIVSFGTNPADFQFVPADHSAKGMVFDILHNGNTYRISSRLSGTFNIYNVGSVFALGMAMGLDPDEMIPVLERFEFVPGRFQKIELGQPFSIVIDYAHTPDSVEKILKALNEITENRLIAVYGCGGNRDRGKRKLMGRFAELNADLSIVTSDNPRDEDPVAIIEDTLEGYDDPDKAIVEADRKEAIKIALQTARPGDTVALLGKGHEDYQVVEGRRLPFNEYEIISGYLTELNII